MYGFARSKLQVPYIFINSKNKRLATPEEVEKYKNNEQVVDEKGEPKEPFIFYHNKKFVYLMYKDNPRLYVETRDIEDGKTSPVYYKQIGLNWNITEKEFTKYKDNLPLLTLVCKEHKKITTILPGTMFHITSGGKLIREKFEPNGKIIINDRRKKFPFDWNKQTQNVEAKSE